MNNKRYEIESQTPFSESLLWQLNSDYYHKEGLEAWRDGTVPAHLTTNSMVGKTYAELIFGFLRDLATKGQMQEKVYFLELGGGNGRLAFHVLKHLELLRTQMQLDLPPYCYIFSDIVEDNLSFIQNHKQLQTYFEQGLLDVSYFDGIKSEAVQLRYSGKTIVPKSLAQPLLVIANYFFDSIPNDLFHFKHNKISACTVSLETTTDPKNADAEALLKQIEVTYQDLPIKFPYYKETDFNTILQDYFTSIFDTYLFFPHRGLRCIDNLRAFSQQGLLLLTMDKGFHEIHDLENQKKPEIITHGSFSIWVNYHAYGAYCRKQNGKVFFPSFSTFNLQLGCLMFLPDSETYTKTAVAYQRFVNDYGPDDFNGLKKLTYKHIALLTLQELIGILRLSAYDSTMFINVLPRIKQLSTRITFNERTRLAQTMHKTWNMYYTINEPEDLAFEIGGILYALGYYKEALTYFQFSINQFGHTADIFYNRALCYYQLRQDALFLTTVKTAKSSFPDYAKFIALDKLDLGAV